VEREIEDIDALIAEAGGWVHLSGVSSGGALALETAATGLSGDRRARSEEDIAGARTSPFWLDGEALADTLAYDAACLGDGLPSTARFATITQPTLVATGVDARRPGAPAWVLALDEAADAIAATIPQARRQIMEGQSHVADPKAVALMLQWFFRG
jgi:hypothetical protein